MNEDQILKIMQPCFGNIQLENPLVLGAGLIKTVDGADGLEHWINKVNASMLTVGSFTMNPCAGNSGEVLVDCGAYHINRMGLPNKGKLGLKDLKPLIELAHQKGKKICLSLAVRDEPKKELFKLFNEIEKEYKPDVVEINISCPNVEGNMHMIEYADFSKLLVDLAHNLNFDYTLKLPLITTIDVVKALAFAEKMQLLHCISLINTIPFCYDPKTKMFGGMSGSYLYPIVLGNVKLLRDYDYRGDIFADGGVSTGKQAVELLKAGATAISMVSSVLNDSKVFDRVQDEMIDILENTDGF